MRLINIIYYLAVIVLIAKQAFAQNTNPVVTNVVFSISGTTVTVTYDVADAEQNTLTISMGVSSNNGATWDYDYTTPGPVTGAIGTGVVKGTGKTITWIYTGAYNNQFQIRIFANDETADGSPCPGIATVTYAGKTYNTIQIGDQCWLKENLNVGTRINGSADQTNNSTIEKYCYNDVESNCTTYGGEYQWAEAIQYQNGATNTTSPNPAFTGNVQGICPSGWHIPSLVEFQTLSTTVSNDANSLKAVGQGSGTNTSGFSALLAGCRGINGTVGTLDFNTFFSSSTENSPDNAFYVYLYAYFSDIYLFYNEKENGYSVRCLKD